MTVVEGVNLHGCLSICDRVGSDRCKFCAGNLQSHKQDEVGEKIRIAPGCSPMETGGSQMESAKQERGDVYLHSAVKLRCFLPWVIVAKEDLHKSKGQPEKSFGGYETELRSCASTDCQGGEER